MSVHVCDTVGATEGALLFWATTVGLGGFGLKTGARAVVVLALKRRRLSSPSTALQKCVCRLHPLRDLRRRVGRIRPGRCEEWLNTLDNSNQRLDRYMRTTPRVVWEWHDPQLETF
jgi:hypothetical protein